MPLEDETGYIRINDESCHGLRQGYQYGAAHKQSGQKLQILQQGLDPCGLEGDLRRTSLFAPNFVDLCEAVLLFVP